MFRSKDASTPARRAGRCLHATAILSGFAILLSTSAARAVVIASGSYTGAAGNTNNPPEPGYLFDASNSGSVITGGTFVGGAGAGLSASTVQDSAGGGAAGVSVTQPGASVTISGGSLTGGTGGSVPSSVSPSAEDQPGSGGDALDVIDSGSAIVTGGTFTAGGPGSGGADPAADGADFNLYNDGTLTLIGTFTSAPASPITGDTYGTITGTLANNTTPASYTYLVSTGGQIILLPPTVLPEPSLLGIGAATLLVLNRRRAGRNSPAGRR